MNFLAAEMLFQTLTSLNKTNTKCKEHYRSIFENKKTLFVCCMSKLQESVMRFGFSTENSETDYTSRNCFWKILISFA